MSRKVLIGSGEDPNVVVAELLKPGMKVLQATTSVAVYSVGKSEHDRRKSIFCVTLVVESDQVDEKEIGVSAEDFGLGSTALMFQ